VKINAIILSAGFGSRLSPLTDILPKPLIPVFGLPMLQLVATNLKLAGIDSIAVNTHYLSDQISNAVSEFPEADSFEIFYEPEILGTGGAVVNARSLLKQHDAFLIHNSDILTDFDLRKMLAYHHKSKAKITMVVLDGPENRVRVTPDGKIHDILDSLGRNPGGQLLTYGGVMVISKSIFDYLPVNPENFSIIRAVLDMMRAEPDAVYAHNISGSYWRDLGTLPEYFSAHTDAISGKIRLPDFEQCKAVRFIGEVKELEKVSLNGFVAGGKNCVIGAESTLINCIILDNTVIPPDSFHSCEVLGPGGFSLHRDHRQLSDIKILQQFKHAPYSVSSLIERGSVRGFYRIRQQNQTSVLMISDGMDQDYDRFVIIGNYLAQHHFPTPKILAYEADEYSILVEDFGNETLYKLVSTHGVNTTETEHYYRLAIDALVDFHFRGLELFRKRSAPLLRTFDKSYLRWESRYFSEHFLSALCQVPENRLKSFDSEFDALAALTDQFPKVLIHRDFQSQNLMIHNGAIRFVDFQGARFGSLGYDIMSLLNDPYTELPENLRIRLEKYFRNQVISHLSLSENEIEKIMVVSGLQRSMQALGAYGFLALNKGKNIYLSFVPAGFAALRNGLERLRNLSEPPLKLDSLTEFINDLKLPEIAEVKPQL